MKKAAIYTRVSSLEQAKHGFSIRQQKDRLLQYAEMNELSVHEVYEDSGWSGTNTDRPALQRLLSDCEAGLFDVVLVFKLDRLSRSVPKTYQLFEFFDKHKVKFVSISEGFDTSTAYGKGMSGFLSVMAQMENSVRVERVTEGKIGKAKRGEPMSGHNPPFGYSYDKQNKRYVINEEQANVVREIYDLYLSGLGGNEIVATLNKNGHIGKDVPWTRTHMRRILDNVVYIGKQQFKGEIYEANHEPIIDEETFEMVQKQREIREKKAYRENNPRPWKSKYILSGLLRCGKCGSRMELKVARWKTKDGKRMSNDKYRCVNSYHTPIQKEDPSRIQCSSKHYSRAELEDTVLKEVSALRESDVKVKKEKELSQDYSAELKQIGAKLTKLKNLYLEDLIGFEELKKDTDKLKERKKRIEQQMKNTAGQKNEASEMKDLIKNGINFSGMSITRTKYVLNTLIDHISIGDDGMTIYWNF
ncbi:recombinase family protein [Atopococcus tabaci]|uniref:recombinase family protein n=1 Tax=Atopococcus tabaci TaxID=269774 RepID=UPI00240A5547|nr:recombinase family protein [Atopococcus tabaci]